jgi:hypothetical protein
MKKILLIVFVALTYSHAGFTQSTFSGWFASFNTVKLNSKFSLHTDIAARSTHQWEHFGTYIIRPGINYHINKKMIATVGYAYVAHRRTIDGVNGYTPEHRIWEQFIFSQPVAFTTLQHRLRLEQRFIARPELKSGEISSGDYMYANRLRYFFRDVIPFSGQKQFAKGVFASVQNEIFVNLGDKSNVNGKFFDQNRAYISVGYRFVKSFDAEIGYMNQYVSGKGSSYVNNNILQLATYLRL